MAKQYTKKQVETGLKLKLSTDLAFAKMAILIVYGNQTASEQCAAITSDSNGIGFTGCDAEILTSFAQRIERNGFFSPKMNSIILRKAPRYWRQILPKVREDAIPSLVALVPKQAVPAPSVCLSPSSPNWENSEIAHLCR